MPTLKTALPAARFAQNFGPVVPFATKASKSVHPFTLRRLEDTDSGDMDTAGTSGSYFFSSWGYGNRLILRDLYRRYAFSKIHIMKKIEQSGRGRSCEHWLLWRAMAKVLLSEARKKISPKDLENFFWDVLAEGSEVAATLDRLLDCRHAVRSPRARSTRAVVSKLKDKTARRTSATISSEGIDEGGGQRKTALLDLSPRWPLCEAVKSQRFLLDEQGAVALFEPTAVEGGAGAPTEFAVLQGLGAGLDNDIASTLDVMLKQISITSNCQPDGSAAEYAFMDCTEDAALVGVEPMFSDGSGSTENADAAAVVRRIIAGASPEPTPPPVQRVDQGVQCDLYWALMTESMQREQLLHIAVLRAMRDASRKKMKDPARG